MCNDKVYTLKLRYHVTIHINQRLPSHFEMKVLPKAI